MEELSKKNRKLDGSNATIRAVVNIIAFSRGLGATRVLTEELQRSDNHANYLGRDCHKALRITSALIVELEAKLKVPRRQGSLDYSKVRHSES